MFLNDQEKASRFAEHFKNLDETASIEALGEGCNGTGRMLVLKSETDERRFFIKTTNSSGFGNEAAGRRLARHIDNAVEYPHSIPVHAVLGVDDDGQVLGELTQLSEAVTIAELLEGSENFLSLLRNPETSAEDVRAKTLAMAEAMADIHELKYEGAQDDAEALYLYATNSIIHDGELTPGVRDFSLRRGDQWLSSSQFAKITSNMIQVREMMGCHPERLGRIQGDFWASNVFFDPDMTISITDSRTVWGEPGIDAAWMIGEFCMQDLIRTGSFNGEFTQVAREALEVYKDRMGDENLEEFMHLPYAFQAFAEAVFTPNLSDEQRQIMMAAANGALLAGLAGQTFDMGKLEEYAVAGWEDLYN